MAENLTGKRFGKLTVLYEVPERKSGHIYWHCKCDCGNEKDIIGTRLRTGKTQSCGCLRSEKSIKIIPKGSRFGQLTVIEMTDKRLGGNVIWKCQCDCGNICEISGNSLLSQHTKSCGCLREVNLIGKQFGYLIVLDKTDKRSSDGGIVWHCKCNNCGKECDISNASLRKGAVSCGCINGSLGEQKIQKILQDNNIIFEREKIFNDCKFLDTNRPAKFDFYINNSYIIEFDGDQHFNATGGWNNEKNLIKTQEHDVFKEQYCFNHNIPIIRIPYWYLENIELKDLLLENNPFLIKNK